jgi:hypothetical protein
VKEWTEESEGSQRLCHQEIHFQGSRVRSLALLREESSENGIWTTQGVAEACFRVCIYRSSAMRAQSPKIRLGVRFDYKRVRTLRPYRFPAPTSSPGLEA